MAEQPTAPTMQTGDQSPLDYPLGQDAEVQPTGFDAWFASLMSARRQIKGNMRGEKIMGGTFSGMNTEEARQKAQEMWQQLPPDQQNEWATKATGSPLLAPSEQGDQAPKELPPLLRNNPNAPGLNSPTMGTYGGKSGTSPGQNVVERFVEMGAAQAVRAAGAKEAVTAKRVEQVLNPGQTVDAARAVRDAALAQSGITDMGGGTMALNNKYGTGFATQRGPATPGAHVWDNGKPVDMAASRTKNSIVTMPGDNAVPSVAFKEDIAAKVSAAAPGAGARLAGDRLVEQTQYVLGQNYQKDAKSLRNWQQAQVAAQPKGPDIQAVNAGAVASLPFPVKAPVVQPPGSGVLLPGKTLRGSPQPAASAMTPVVAPVQPTQAATPVAGSVKPPAGAQSDDLAKAQADLAASRPIIDRAMDTSLTTAGSAAVAGGKLAVQSAQVAGSLLGAAVKPIDKVVNGNASAAQDATRRIVNAGGGTRDIAAIKELPVQKPKASYGTAMPWKQLSPQVSSR